MTKTTTKFAATHYGECQLCGHTQKLPGGGFLSLHGYTKQWGFFAGTCPGSRHLPYEQSTDLIEGAIRNNNEFIQSLRDSEKATRAERNFIYASERSMDRRGYNQTAPVVLSRDEVTFNSVYGNGEIKWFSKSITRANGEPRQMSAQASRATTLDELIADLNAKKADRILAQAAQVQQYVEWLAERKAKFVARELRPVAEDDQGSKQTLLHGFSTTFRGGKYCASSAMGALNGNYTKDWSQVTCKKCIKEHDAALARAAAKA